MRSILFRKRQHNLAKVLSLALGLAISAVLIAEVCYEQTFDTHFPGATRTYRVMERFKAGDMKEAATAASTPGAWAPGLKQYAPMVEAATRVLGLFGDQTRLHMDDGTTLKSSITLADSCFFDVFPRRILVGNAKEALSRKCCVMVSSDIAKAIGGQVAGRHFTVDEMPGVTFTIGGVFEAFPWGSSQHGEDMLLSLNTLSYASFDGSNNWVGNDSYRSFIRLAPGHKPEELLPYARKALADHADAGLLTKAGVDLAMDFQTLNAYHNSDSYVKTMKWILSVVAFLLLFASVMNYLLFVVGNMVGRSREMAVRKCYGAERKDIYRLILGEAAVQVTAAVALAALLVFACKGTVEQFLSAPVAALVLNQGAWLLAAIVVAVVLVGGLIPAWLYNRTPVTAAFRGWAETRHRWKLALLAAEFAVAGLMFSLLWVVGSQYKKMVGLDPGYDYDNVAILCVQGSTAAERKQCLAELERMPQVLLTSSASHLPIDGWFGSGNNVSLPGADKELFNAEDLYYVSDNYCKLMGIKLLTSIAGASAAEAARGRLMLVDSEFVRRLQKATHWPNVVGKRVFVSEHCNDSLPSVTVVGVFSPIRLGGVNHAADGWQRPAMMFPCGAIVMPDMLLKLNSLTPDVMRQIRAKVERMFPGKEVELCSYAAEYEQQYVQQRHFRDGILAGGIIVLVIALFGLVGYSSDEVSRRSKEIAIRKINGATAGDILRLFLRGILRIALPSVAVGCVAAALIAGPWLQNFSVRIALTPWPFLAVTALILLVIAASVAANCRRIANSNPVGYLKDE